MPAVKMTNPILAVSPLLRNSLWSELEQDSHWNSSPFYLGCKIRCPNSFKTHVLMLQQDHYPVWNPKQIPTDPILEKLIKSLAGENLTPIKICKTCCFYGGMPEPLNNQTNLNGTPEQAEDNVAHLFEPSQEKHRLIRSTEANNRSKDTVLY